MLESVDPTDEKVRDLSEELRVLEELWLEKLNPYGERGYNPAPRIDAWTGPQRSGLILSPAPGSAGSSRWRVRRRRS